MRALVWDGARARVVEDAPDPYPGEGQAIVRVLRAGVCSTDLEIVWAASNPDHRTWWEREW